MTGALLSVVVTIAAFYAKSAGSYHLPAEDMPRLISAVELGLFTSCGVSLLAVSVLDLAREKDAASWLLFFWVVGTFLFATFINWTINGRSLLPMIPAAGILIDRRIRQRARAAEGGASRTVNLRRTVMPLMGAAAVALAVTWADFRLAESAQTVSAAICDRYMSRYRNVWFSGHWGFQYYMEAAGARPIDVSRSDCLPGDVFVGPYNNTNPIELPAEDASLRETIEEPAGIWIATMNDQLGAGFYSADYGLLPFTVGSIPSERYDVFDYTPGLRRK